jgi:hypothetical protein
VVVASLAPVVQNLVGDLTTAVLNVQNLASETGNVVQVPFFWLRVFWAYFFFPRTTLLTMTSQALLNVTGSLEVDGVFTLYHPTTVTVGQHRHFGLLRGSNC